MAIILIRTLIIFLALIVAMRLMGKRQLGELELSELVVAVLIADIASIPLQNPSLPLSYGLIPLLVLFCCELIFSGLRTRAFTCASCSTAGRTSSSSAAAARTTSSTSRASSPPA